VLVTVLAVAAAVFLVVRLPGRATEAADKAAASALPSPASDGSQGGPGDTPGRRPPPPSRPRPITGTPGAPRAVPPADIGRADAGRPVQLHTGAGQPPAGQSPAGQSAAAQQVLALITKARAKAGLPAYTISSGLDASASPAHLGDGRGCGLSQPSARASRTWAPGSPRPGCTGPRAGEKHR